MGTTEDEMAGWHHWLDGRESEWTPGVGDGQGGLACCDSWGHKELGHDWATELNWTETTGQPGKSLPILNLYRNCVHPSSILFWSCWGCLRDASCSLPSPGLVSLLSTQTPVFLAVNTEMSLDCQRIRPGWWARQGGMKMPIIFHKQNKLIYRFKENALQEHPTVRTFYWNRILHVWRQNKMDSVACFPSLLSSSD